MMHHDSDKSSAQCASTFFAPAALRSQPSIHRQGIER